MVTDFDDVTNQQQALLVVEQSRDSLLAQITAIEVKDTATESQAVQLLNQVKDKEKQINDFISSWTQPLETQKKRWFTVRDNLLAPIVPIKKALNDALIEYRRGLMIAAQKEQERLRALQEKRMERAAAAGKPNPIPEVILPYVPVPDKTIEGMTYTETWKAEVIDVAIVPTFFNGVQIMFPSQSVLNQMARLNKGENPPPGVVFKKEIGTRSK